MGSLAAVSTHCHSRGRVTVAGPGPMAVGHDELGDGGEVDAVVWVATPEK
jgi:hypothetical protein